jgi:ABC-type multidrug transport system fused ATPase/permease subunit
MSLPDNYDFDVKNASYALIWTSQLIAFLRAYVSNPSILILVEAFHQLIPIRINSTCTETITKGRTSIVITHRLNYCEC